MVEYLKAKIMDIRDNYWNRYHVVTDAVIFILKFLYIISYAVKALP